MDKLIEMLATKETIWGAIYVASVGWFMLSLVIPMRNRHFKTMDVVEGSILSGVVNDEKTIAGLREINTSVNELRDDLKVSRRPKAATA